MFGDVGGDILDIKVVGSHHLALRRCNAAEPWKVEVEVLALSEISEGSTHRRLFSHVWNQSRFENLEEGIISSDGRTLLLKFKLRYRGGETISKEHVVTSAEGKCRPWGCRGSVASARRRMGTCGGKEDRSWRAQP
jgi:hypothetical protein